MTGATGEVWGVWLHAVAREATPISVAGIGGAAVEVVRAAGLCAFVSRAVAGDDDAAVLRERLEDPSWLGRAAFEHHRVVEAVAAAGPVVPASLATVYHDESGLAAALERHRGELAAALDRVAGRTEWGVKAYERADAPAGSGAAPAATGGGPGLAYLNRRRAELSARDRRHQEAADAAAAVHDRLSHRAVAAALHPPQDRRVSGEPDPMVLNGAYLVDDERTEDFEREVRALARGQAALRLRLTGPWPPYSFVPALAAAPHAQGDRQA